MIKLQTISSSCAIWLLILFVLLRFYVNLFSCQHCVPQVLCFVNYRKVIFNHLKSVRVLFPVIESMCWQGVHSRFMLFSHFLWLLYCIRFSRGYFIRCFIVSQQNITAIGPPRSSLLSALKQSFNHEYLPVTIIQKTRNLG